MKHLTLIVVFLWLMLTGITAMLVIGRTPSAYPTVVEDAPAYQAGQQN